jgi:hypothetical protein
LPPDRVKFGPERATFPNTPEQIRTAIHRLEDDPQAPALINALNTPARKWRS